MVLSWFILSSGWDLMGVVLGVYEFHHLDGRLEMGAWISHVDGVMKRGVIARWLHGLEVVG